MRWMRCGRSRFIRLVQMKTHELVDTTEKKMDFTSLRWEDNIQFWEVLKRIVDEEPVSDKFPVMYGLLASLRD